MIDAYALTSNLCLKEIIDLLEAVTFNVHVSKDEADQLNAVLISLEKRFINSYAIPTSHEMAEFESNSLNAIKLYMIRNRVNPDVALRIMKNFEKVG